MLLICSFTVTMCSDKFYHFGKIWHKRLVKWRVSQSVNVYNKHNTTGKVLCTDLCTHCFWTRNLTHLKCSLIQWFWYVSKSCALSMKYSMWTSQVSTISHSLTIPSTPCKQYSMSHYSGGLMIDYNRKLIEKFKRRDNRLCFFHNRLSRKN